MVIIVAKVTFSRYIDMALCTATANSFCPFAMVRSEYKFIIWSYVQYYFLQHGDDVPRHFLKVQSPHEDVGVFRVSGVFPTFSKDGSKLAFVDNEFKAVWLADSKGLRVVFEVRNCYH